MQPRPHQIKMLEGTRQGWKQFRRQMVVCPTGGGKTPFFAWVAKEEPGRTLILAHRDELIDQAIDKVHAATGIRAEKEKAEHHASLDAKVVCGSVQSLCREGRRERWPKDHFSLVVVDETHRILADSYRNIVNHFNSRLLGVTATPIRSDKKNLGEIFENIACEIPLYTKASNPNPGLVNAGLLSPITVDLIPLKIDLSNAGVSMDADSGCRDFNKSDLDSILTPHLNEIARQIKLRASDRMSLGFAPLIETARKASEACQSAGLVSEYVYGDDPQRAEKLERFKNWEYDILWNSMLLTEGYDNPSISCIVPLSFTKSTGLFSQMIGRGTRLDSLKENLKVMDFLYQSGSHDICRPAHLIAETQEEAEVIMRLVEEQQAGMPADVAEQMPLDLQDLANAATSQREETLRKKLEENRKKKGKYISAEEFALQHHRLDVAEFEPVSAWHSLDVTEPQSRALKRAKIDPESVKNRGHANALLSVHFNNQKLTLASPGQRRKMAQLGYENSESATAAEARQFFAGLRSQAA